MKALFAFVVVLVATVGLIACGGGGSSQSSSAPAAAPNAGAPAAAAGAAEYGVPECDEYIKKYEACINSKVPEAARASVKQGLEASKASFKQAAATEQGKAGLATGCKQALDAAKTAMSSYGCTW
jgi:hypothetical protein